MADIVVSGGGLVGGMAAIALATAGLKVKVIDREPLSALSNPAQDGRTTAVNYASQQLMENLDLWSDVEPYSEAIWQIRALEAQSPWSIQFDHERVGDHAMGFIVENAYLRQAIIRCAQRFPNLQWYAEDEIKCHRIHEQGRTITLKSGEEIHTPLLIVAEGKNSPTRKELGIKVTYLPYHQKGIVFSMTHEKQHHGQAWEIFSPEGPLAFLPAKSDQGNRSGIVWTLPEDQADHWFLQDNNAVEVYLSRLFPFYGKLKVMGKRWIFPISAQYAHQFVDQRVALIGDAAHVCHYVAGQGVNLGWRDVAILRDCIVHQKNLGLDLGSQVMLKSYQRQRRFDSLTMVGSTDLTVRLFSNQSSVLHVLRNAGLGFVNQVSPLKRTLMRYAMGIIGHKPTLMRSSSS